MRYKSLGNTSVRIPQIIFGTSCLGNLYQALPPETKLQILQEIFSNVDGPVVLDSAGKYGAGLALEVIGDGLDRLNIEPERVQISNKLGWYRTPLTTAEPTFEPGAWMSLEHDAVQKISYNGIRECWDQGAELLGAAYKPALVSVHDPDEYLAAATTTADRQQRFADIVGAYQALAELKARGEVKAVGVGAKDWKIIREINREVELDWVMLAVSFTIFHHPPELLDFVDELTSRKIGIINSAVFHAGFLAGGDYFDYRMLNENKDSDKPYFAWRKRFFRLCNQYNVTPADACVQFGMSHPGVVSIALNTSKPDRVKQNVESVQANVPSNFWAAMKNDGLIDRAYPYVGA